MPHFEAMTATVVVLVLAAMVARRMGVPQLMAPTCMLVNIIIMQTWVLLLGLLGALNIHGWRIMTWGVVGLCIALAAITRQRDRPLSRLNETSRLDAQSRSAAVATLAVMAVLVIVAVITSSVGPFLGDVLQYHMAAPTDWVAEQRIAAKNWPDPRTWSAQGNGLLAVWWMLPIRDVNTGLWAGLFWLAFASATMWALVRQLGASTAAAAAAVLMLQIAPGMVWQAIGGMNDVAIWTLALYGLLCLAVRRLEAVHVALLMVAGAVGLGVKPTILPVWVPLMFVALTRFVAQRRRERGLVLPRSHHVDSERPMANVAERAVSGYYQRSTAGWHRWAVLGTVACAALTCGTYWYIRNWALHQDPFYPATLRIAGTTLFRGVGEHSGGNIGWARFEANVYDLVTKHLLARSEPDVPAAFTAGMGWYPVMGAIGMAVLLCRNARWRWIGSATLMITVCTCAAVIEGRWSGRFFGYLAFVSIAAIVCAPRYVGSVRMRRLWLVGAVVTSCASGSYLLGGLLPSEIYEDLRQSGFSRVDLGRVYPHSIGDHLQSLSSVPPEETLAVSVPFRSSSAWLIGPVSLLHGPEIRRRLRYYGGVPSYDEVRQLAEGGVEWILFIVPRDVAEMLANRASTLGLDRVAGGLFSIRANVVAAQPNVGRNRDGGGGAAEE